MTTAATSQSKKEFTIDDGAKHMDNIDNLSDTSVKKYLKQHGLWFFNVIFTFDPMIIKEHQYIFDLIVPAVIESDNRVSDDILLGNLFQYLLPREIRALTKISTCMYYTKDLPDFLKVRNGKYFFINQDSETTENKNFRDEYLADINPADFESDSTTEDFEE
jgi:hypothetical protein